MEAASAPRRRARTRAVSSRSLRWAGIVVCVAAAGALLGYIAEYALVARAAHMRADLRRELYHLRQENTNLRARVATLERPSRIENLARTQGMKQRSEAVFVSMAPKPVPPQRVEPRPILAGFLPESVAGLFHRNSSARK